MKTIRQHAKPKTVTLCNPETSAPAPDEIARILDAKRRHFTLAVRKLAALQNRNPHELEIEIMLESNKAETEADRIRERDCKEKARAQTTAPPEIKLTGV